MKRASNLTAKILSTVFSKFAEEKAFMLECNMAYIASWHFGSDCMSIVSNAPQKVFLIVLSKRKNCGLCNI